MEAFEAQICLIEWPEILGDLAPETSLDIELDARRDGHIATLTYGENWKRRLKNLDADA